jgi:beta-glucanase (GH16 family)
VFLTKPKKPVSLLLGNLHTIGSAQLNASKDYEVKNFTAPADRDKPASPPAWLGTRPPVYGEWTQTLDQTFKNQKAIDEKIWSFELPWDGLLKGLTMYYTKKEVVLEDGVLKIRIQKRRGHAYDNPAFGERDYATGLLITYDKWTQLYGYFEARIKMPTTPGIWPAFWTMPDRGAAFSKEWYKRDNTTSGGMEMDVIEYYVNRGPGRYGAGMHWDGYGDQHKASGSSYLYHPETKDRWHNYGMLWEPGKITFYCDGINTLEFKSDRVCSVPSYILLNGQTGGYAGPVDDAKLPDAMQVEYVRVWQRKDLAEIAKKTVIPPL